MRISRKEGSRTAEQQVLGDPGDIAPGIRLVGVGKHYGQHATDLVALAETDLAIDSGEFVSIVGPSGCGKTTLQLIAAGLVAPTSGFVEVDRKRISGPYPGMGVVFQKDALLEWRTVLNNLLLVPEMLGRRRRLYQKKAQDLLEMTGLAEFARYYPSQLSGGMRQRVAICRALMTEPKVLFMDEPFAALDALTREQLQVDLSMMLSRRQVTTLFVTHSIEEAVALSDRVVVMTASPGSVYDIVTISLPRPRGLAVRKDPEFEKCTQSIRNYFLSAGVLRER